MAKEIPEHVGRAVRQDTLQLGVEEEETTIYTCVDANGEQIKDLGEETIPFKTNEGIQRCITFRSAKCCHSFSMQKVVRAGSTVVLDEKNPRREQRCVHDGHVDLLR